MSDIVARENERLLLEERHGWNDNSFALKDLAQTPDATMRARFMGEWFYGATEVALLAKLEEFASAAGDDMVVSLREEGPDFIGPLE